MKETIYREDAIDALMSIVKSASLRNRNVYSTARKCLKAIEELPLADEHDEHRVYIPSRGCGKSLILNAYKRGWEEGREALRKELWEDGRDRCD